MSAPKESDPKEGAPVEGNGVLSNLPRTRPQRSSPRRAAARAAAAGTATEPSHAPAGTPRKPASTGNGRGSRKPAGQSANGSTPRAPTTRSASADPKRTRASGAHRSPPVDRAPRQGYESEGERASGPVQPPGGAELLASALEAVSELTRAGVSGGERLLKDFLGRLPLS